MSSLAFGREWSSQRKLFFVRGFATVVAVASFSGFAALVIAVNVTAVTAAVSRHDANSAVPLIVAIRTVLKEGWTTGIVSDPIVDDFDHVPA